MKPVFSTSGPPMLKVTGRNYGYPVRRIFCVGRNYAEHVLELGNKVEKKHPFYFTKSAFSLLIILWMPILSLIEYFLKGYIICVFSSDNLFFFLISSKNKP